MAHNLANWGAHLGRVGVLVLPDIPEHIPGCEMHLSDF